MLNVVTAEHTQVNLLSDIEAVVANPSKDAAFRFFSNSSIGKCLIEEARAAVQVGKRRRLSQSTSEKIRSMLAEINVSFDTAGEDLQTWRSHM
jgi:hypothetical protein